MINHLLLGRIRETIKPNNVSKDENMTYLCKLGKYKNLSYKFERIYH